MLYFIEQCLNGLQIGMLLFLLAAGLTLIFGIMNLVNLAHGSLYMLGAYFAATFAAWTGSFLAAVVLTIATTLAVGHTFRNGARLGSGRGTADERGELARLMLRDHVACLAAITGVLVLQLGFAS